MDPRGSPDRAEFEALIEPIDAERAQTMIGVSWHPGCPVSIAELRLISMDHWDFDSRLQRGVLVAHADVADDLVSVFGQLFAARFPIARMRAIEFYGGDDDASMA